MRASGRDAGEVVAAACYPAAFDVRDRPPGQFSPSRVTGIFIR
ncbi:MAG: hypothetical protein AB1330_03915 [Bacillota bacterium]